MENKRVDITLEDLEVSEELHLSDHLNKKDYDIHSWGDVGDGIYTAQPKSVKKLPAGNYKLGNNQTLGVYLQKYTYPTDDIYTLPDGKVQDIVKDLKKFTNSKHLYEKYNYIHKRGFLLEGAPGNGKTALVHLITEYITKEKGGISINISGEDDIDRYLNIYKDIESLEGGRMLVVVLEDIDSLMDSYMEGTVLNMLDGKFQKENVVYIATTNYPEKLKENVKNRPSRFDRKVRIENPSDEVRRYYVERKFKDDNISKEKVDHIVEKTKGFTMSHLKEYILSTIILNNSEDYTDSNMSEVSKNKNIGFGRK